jgi:alcohol dehydrogenase class IV
VEMKPIQVNEELIGGCEFFATGEYGEELVDLFKFDQRRVLLGEGAAYHLGDECTRLKARRVFLVRDPAVAEFETTIRWTLEREGAELVGVYDEVVPNPTVASVDRFAARIAETDCDAVVALGGGSTMDTVKVGLAVATEGGSAADYFGFDQFAASPRWPLIAMPTTAGTGAEASRVAVVVAEEGKQAVYSDHIQPRVAIVDPLLTSDLPPVLTAITGLDALGHALECTASKKSGAVGDAVAREALRSGMPHIAAAVEGGRKNPEARYEMSRCSLLAGMLLSPINTGAAHALGYGIEKISHALGKPVPHGTAVALVLPGVIRHNAPVSGDKYYYAAGVAGLDLGGGSREAGVELMAEWIDTFRRRYTPFGSLTAAGLGEEEIPRMVEIGMGVRRLLDPNPVEVTAEDAAAIYRQVLQ